MALERAAAGTDDPAVARQALLLLADLDIAADDCARAARWLDRVPHHPSQADPELALRRAECLWATGQAAEARTWAEQTGALEEGGRVRLLRARLAQRWPDQPHGGDAISLALAALLLDTPGAEELLVQLVAECRDAALVGRVRRVMGELGRLAEPQWQAAFALAEGRRDDARSALLEGTSRGEPGAVKSLLTLARQWRDLEALRHLAEQADTQLPADLQLLLDAHNLQSAGDDTGALALLETACRGESGDWARQLLAELVASWVPAGQAHPAAWDALLGELRQAATSLDRLDLIAPVEALAVERQRPLFVAVLGEFNAGKSTLLNALLGTDVAPTGIRPTTASLHWVAWAPDPFARVLVRGDSDRVVPHDELKRCLEELHDAGSHIERVLIYAPIERLKRIELLDTPGFNAPNVSHAEEARRGVEEAHVALWLLDATAPLKNTERRVIEQVAAAGVPIQVLVNKRDRVSDAELVEVMHYVSDALQSVGITSLRPPLALSAQLALSGRLGDEEALAQSGWDELEQLLAEHIVNRCDGLRERALRRKAARLAAQLIDAAGSRARDQAARRAAARQRRELLAGVAARLQSKRSSFAETVAAGLDTALAELREDARPIAQLTEERRRDPEVRSYLADRTVARLTPAICAGIARVARRVGEQAPASAVDLTKIFQRQVGATVGGAAAAHRSGAYLHGDALTGCVEMAISAAAEAIAEAAESQVDEALDPSLELRLTSLSEALVRRAATESAVESGQDPAPRGEAG
ncbi:MAG: dynamin family protein [Deltaproteobacteria bacterium]|nr:dynamin family protein [Deltaproteobacteria bacterium]